MITAEDIEAFTESNEYYNPVQDEVHTINIMNLVEIYRTLAKQDKNLSLAASLVDEEYDEWSEANIARDKAAELKEMADLVYVLFGLANANNWDLNEAIKRVHENNVGRMYQEDGTIRYREDGKVIKNKYYPIVNLEDLV